MVPLIKDIPLFHEIYILFDFTFIQCVSHLHETMATLNNCKRFIKLVPGFTRVQNVTILG